MCEIPNYIPENGYGFIYKYECCGKIYIGQTTQPIRYRHAHHLCGHLYIDDMIRTHNFKLSIIYTCPIDELDLMEKIFIKEYDSLIPKGYNCTEGGQDGVPQMLKKLKLYSDPVVYQYSNTGECIGRYHTIREASMVTDISYDSIRECLRGKSKQCQGYFWSKEYLNPFPIPIIKNTPKQVAQYSKSGELLNIYPSIQQAMKQTGINHIHTCAKGKLKSAGGYGWKYYYE